MLCLCPSRDHNSSVICGANGASIIKNFSNSSLANPSACASLTNIIIADTAVLNFIFSISSVIFFMVLCNNTLTPLAGTRFPSPRGRGGWGVRANTFSKNLLTPFTPSMLQGIVSANGPINISYKRKLSAPTLFTTSSGLITLPKDLDIFLPSSASTMPCETRRAYGSLTGTSPQSYKNLFQKREYNKCKVVCSIPPLYKSTGSQYFNLTASANALLFLGSQ